MTKKVLVTGADGFIGSHLVDKLVRDGYKVKAFCLYNIHGSWGWLDELSPSLKNNIEVDLGDIRDFSSVKSAMDNCDVVFHLAALISIPYSYKSPYSYIETNIKGTLNVLESAKILNTQRLIITSTSEVYGSAQYVPINENHPLSAQSPYAASKIGADQLALSYRKSFNIPLTILRPFNTYGPRQSTRAVIPTIITQIASGERNIKLGLITPTRDFNYVEDTCSAFIAVSDSQNCIGRVINASSNFEISIEKTVKIISEQMNMDIQIISDEKRLRPKDSEVSRLFGDNTLLKKLTMWEPKYEGVDGFKKGISKTAKWFSNPKNLEFYNLHRHNL